MKKYVIINSKHKNKNDNKDKINNTISYREPEAAENLASKNYLLSP